MVVQFLVFHQQRKLGIPQRTEDGHRCLEANGKGSRLQEIGTLRPDGITHLHPELGSTGRDAGDSTR
jgi:hypothetical protein